MSPEEFTVRWLTDPADRLVIHNGENITDRISDIDVTMDGSRCQVTVVFPYCTLNDDNDK